MRLFYQGRLVADFSTSSPEGCRILHGLLPTENEHIYGPSAVEPVCFPSPTQTCASSTAAGAMTRLLPHLQRGVLLWMAHDGMFAKRFCQGRVYWDGPLAPWHDRPNKLERERTCKLLDIGLLLRGRSGGGRRREGVRDGIMIMGVSEIKGAMGQKCPKKSKSGPKNCD